MRALVLALLSLSFAPSIALAQLVVVPPVVGPNVKKWEKSIGAEMLKKVDGAKIRRVKLDKAKAETLRACKNTLSCLAEASAALDATHFLHTIVARRGNEVKVQFTLVVVSSAKPITQQRMKTDAKKAKVLASIKDGMDAVIEEMEKLPELGPGGAASEPLAVFTPPPSPTPPVVVKPTPEVKPEPRPETPTPPIAAPKPEPKPEPRAEPKPEPEPAPAVRTQASPGLLVRETAPEPGPNWLAWGTLGGGVALAGAGTLMLILANSDISTRNETPQIDTAMRQDLTDSAGMKQNLGVSFLIAGGAAVATGVVFHVLGIGADEPAAQRSWLVGPAGGYVRF